MSISLVRLISTIRKTSLLARVIQTAVEATGLD